MSNFDTYCTLIKAEEIIFAQMHKVARYGDEWNELDTARRVIANLQEKLR